MFLQASVILLTGGVPDTPRTRYTPLDLEQTPPRPGTPPGADTPLDQVHLWNQVHPRSPDQVHPPDQVHLLLTTTPPLGGDTPPGPGTSLQDQVHPLPPEQVHPPWTVNVRAVRILLECNLVPK